MYIVKITDGLGNQMFQYAFAKKMQITEKKEVYLDIRFINNENMVNNCLYKKNDRRIYGLNELNITLPIANDDILKHWNYLKDKKYMNNNLNFKHPFFRYIDENEKKISKITLFPTYYKGYFFSLSYFNEIRSILQKEFTLKNKVKLPKNIYQVIKERNTVCLHVRRGDFLRVNRDISQKNYYPKAIDTMCKKVNCPVFMVFSDDIQWVKNNIKIPGEKYYISSMGFSDCEEMMIMKHCKNNIIANSTFSYWGAYLNCNFEKVVICPKNWKSDIIPKEWIKL